MSLNPTVEAARVAGVILSAGLMGEGVHVSVCRDDLAVFVAGPGGLLLAKTGDTAPDGSEILEVGYAGSDVPSIHDIAALFPDAEVFPDLGFIWIEL